MKTSQASQEMLLLLLGQRVACPVTSHDLQLGPEQREALLMDKSRVALCQ
jgi:hypothetical protein